MYASRREFLKSGAAAVALGAVGESLLADEAAERKESARMKAQRTKARARKRRIIYNDDGCYVAMFDTPEKFIAHRIRQTADTQVDALFLCTGVTGLFLSHFPKAGELIGEFVTDTSSKHARTITASMKALEKSGHDPLALAVDFCREHDKEIFWSMRMNDIHDSLGSCDWLLPRYKREHPDWCLGKREDQKKLTMADPRWWWTALNFEVPEVRDLVFRCFEDVCTRYDVDGIEMDWFRSPLFFPPTMEMKDVSPEHAAMMTDLARRIRDMTDRIGEKRGRPILVAARFPMGVERSLAIGLDVETWLEQDLIDVMTIGGGYSPMAMASTVSRMVEVGHRHSVPVYPCISASGMTGEFGSIEAWRGAAANALRAGADGVLTFNFFPTRRDERLSQIGEIATLTGLDKVYGVDNIVVDRYEGDLRPGLVKPDRLPIALRPGATVTAKLPIGEDVVAGAPAGKRPHVELRLRIDGALAGDEIAVTVNGKAVPSGKWEKRPTAEPEKCWIGFAPQPADVREGDNRVGVTLSAKQTPDRGPVSLGGLTLPLRYE